MSEDVHSALAFGCRSAAILQPLSLPPHSPLLFPIVTLATRGLDCADRARLQDVVHVAPDRADQAGDAGAHPCRVILAGARLWPRSHRPSRGRPLLILLGRVAATLPRLQVSAPRALPGARLGWHPEAGVSPPALGVAPACMPFPAFGGRFVGVARRLSSSWSRRRSRRTSTPLSLWSRLRTAKILPTFFTPRRAAALLRYP